MTSKLTTSKRLFTRTHVAFRWACALVIGCTAIHSVATEAPEAPEVSEVTHETVLCYQSTYSNGPFMGMPDRSRSNSHVRIVTRRTPGEDACLELSADGQLRTVPGTACERPKLADRPCKANP
jgi:hypothetical protein